MITPTRPTAPIELTGTGSRFGAAAIAMPHAFAESIAAICPIDQTPETTAEASRDWWPIALHWSLAGEVPNRAGLVARPETVDQVSAIVAACSAAGVPVTPTAGRSGVVGGSVPIFGGVVLDVTGLTGILHVDATSGIVEVMAGTFGPDLERELTTEHALSVGHFPQSFDLATVGGWAACRGAGQYSTRYGKIEDLVVGLEVVLADGRVVRTGGYPAGATGPDLSQLFIGSEGTLGVITRLWLRTHPVARHEARAAYLMPSFADGVEACRAAVQRGATPAVLRLYDAVESARTHNTDGTKCTLLVVDEGDAALVAATMGIVDDEALRTGATGDVGLVDTWFGHRNDTSALQALTRDHFVVDTMEIAAPWSALAALHRDVVRVLMAVPHARVASCHLSHSYSDGACLYFTFAATPPAAEIESTYVALWDVGQRGVLAGGGNLSHHHGVGISRGRFMAEALGPAFDVLVALKTALDPAGVLNPGKLGLPGPFGPAPWPQPPAETPP